LSLNSLLFPVITIAHEVQIVSSAASLLLGFVWNSYLSFGGLDGILHTLSIAADLRRKSCRRMDFAMDRKKTIDIHLV
jgi:hypothetical protein